MLGKFIHWPNRSRMIGQFGMAFEARIKAFAAFELYRDDVEGGMPVCAAGLGVDIDAVHFLAVDKPDHLSLAQSIR